LSFYFTPAVKEATAGIGLHQKKAFTTQYMRRRTKEGQQDRVAPNPGFGGARNRSANFILNAHYFG
jgi:hypothetical protein